MTQFNVRQVFTETLRDSETLTAKDAFIVTATVIDRVVQDGEKPAALRALLAAYDEYNTKGRRFSGD